MRARHEPGPSPRGRAPAAARWLLLGALALTSPACSASAPPPVAAPAQVELDIFSGRPNPAWTLSGSDDAVLRAKLLALPSASPVVLSNDLGYRGIVVRMSEGAKSRVVRVQRGHVRTEDAGGPADHADPSRDLERWLLQTGRSTLEPGIYDIAARDAS